jgi:hypothetical protein
MVIASFCCVNIFIEAGEFDVIAASPKTSLRNTLLYPKLL